MLFKIKSKHCYLYVLFVLVTFNINAQNFGRGQRGVAEPPVTNIASVSLKDVHEEVMKIIPICVTEFKLDDFEKEILKNFLTNKFESENAILLNESIKGADRRKELDRLDKEFYENLLAIFTTDEIESFKIMDFEQLEKDKKKKKKKKRKKSKS
jgi:hypothetical protein